MKSLVGKPSGRCYHLTLDQRTGRGLSPWFYTPSAMDVFESFPPAGPQPMSENTTNVTSEELDQIESQTDWDRVRNLSDEEIEQAVAEDPDTTLLDEDWFQSARFVVPTAEKKRITIRLDEDIIEHFKREGKGYQSRINAVLKAYVLAQQMKEGE